AVASSLTYIDISFYGKIVAGSRFGTVILTDETLSNLSSFGSGGSFVAFDSYQQPTITTTLNPQHTVNLGTGVIMSGIDFGSIAI
ncbi:MAG: hypothetical protein AB4290_11290, partial [Spirulina sp.]